jgi:hypothetical protein
MAFDSKAYQKEYQKKYRPKNLKKYAEATARWRKNHPDKYKQGYLFPTPGTKAAKKNYHMKTRERWLKYGRKWDLKKKYGITIEQYDVLFQVQNGVCAICKRPERLKKNLAVDHNHETGKVRGLLCTQCNLALSHISEDIVIAESMINYIKSHNAQDKK